jgi:hypothetical protein
MQKPDRSKLKYNEKAMRESAKRPSLPYEPGKDWYPFVVVDAEEFVGDTEKTRGDIIIKCRCAALADIDDPTSKLRPEMQERIPVPVGNPDYPGHEPKGYMYGIAQSRLLAMYDSKELVRPPHREDGKLVFKGKEIHKDEADDCGAECMQACVDLAEKLFFDGPQDLKNRLFLGRVGPDSKGEGYTNIRQTRHIDLGLPKGGGWGPAYKPNGALGVAAPSSRRPSKKKAKKKARSK